MFDSDTGADISISDGHWVGALGVGGWVRYLFEFGLLCVPLILLFLRCRSYDIGMESSILALILAANLIDLIPNSGLTPLTWIIAGALWGRLELGRLETKAETGAAMVSNPMTAGYNRTAALRDTDAAQPRKPSQYTRQTSRHDRRRAQGTGDG